GGRGTRSRGRIRVQGPVRADVWRSGDGPRCPAERTDHDVPRGPGPLAEPVTAPVASDAELGVALVRPGREPAGIGLAKDEKNARERAAKQAVLQALNHRPDTDPSDTDRPDTDRPDTDRPETHRSGSTDRPERPELLVTVADAERLLIAAGGTVTTVETRELEGHVVAWTVASGGPDLEEARA